MKIIFNKNVSYGMDSIDVNGVPIMKIENLYIEKGTVGNVLYELDDEYIVEVLGENYSVLKKDVNRVDD